MRVIAAVMLCFISVLAHLPLAQAQVPNTTAEVQPTEAPRTKKRSRINVNATGVIRINYGQPRWNKSSEKIDTATVIMREGVTGRIVQIQLNETAPDSSLFSGLYSINWQNMEKLQTEFYIPPQETLAQKDGLLKVAKQIQSHEITRNPFILRRLSNGDQTIEIFDTKDQALAAMKVYRSEQLVSIQNQKPTKFPSDQDLETQKQAKVQKDREDAARAASERARMEQMEAARLAELITKQKNMSEAEKAAKKQQANKLATEGLVLFRAENFALARVKFEQAVSLDPDNRMFYYQYGVTLYKVADYNHALVFLERSSGKDVNVAEKNYFIALTHLKLKETDPALKALSDVVASKDATLAPSAQFYKGVIFFEQEKFDQAQSSFQSVLDTSNDSKLDDMAEAYIEQVLRARQADEERKHKWTVSGALGEMYDSNVLLSSNSQRDAGTATNTVGWRSLLSGSLRYRALYSQTEELAAQVDALTLYTVDQSFAYSQNLRAADPTVVTVSLPWTQKGVWFSKAHKLDIVPGYETTVMSVENNVSKAIILSPLLGFANLLVMNEKWFNNITFDIRNDISRLDSSVGDNDSTALKFRLGTTNLLFMNEKKDVIFMPEGALTLNQANGQNSTYRRLDLGAGYLVPTMYATTTNLKLSYFYLDYPTKMPARRTDNSYTATFGLSRKITDIWNAGFLGAYNINMSNEDANTYNKFTALLTLSAAYGF